MVGRGGISLSMLLEDGILESGKGCLTMEYQGKCFIGDLLLDGQIRSCDSNRIFTSPSSWAVYCKQLVNPDKKTGCGWSSLKYRGHKLDTYKATWMKKKNKLKNNDGEEKLFSNGENLLDKKISALPKTPLFNDPLSPTAKKNVFNYNSLGNKLQTNDLNSQVMCETFNVIGKMQPFSITISSNCLFLMDYHSHLTTSEVIGYLGGYWDATTTNLAILQAFPCRCRLNDSFNASAIESEIKQMMYDRQLMLVGWYHSHPFYPVSPTLRDVESQMKYQLRMKGPMDSFTPCVGFICSPYSNSKTDESDMKAFWVMPSHQKNPNEFGKPMHMSHTMAKDAFLSSDVLQDIKLLRAFYIGAQDQIQFNLMFRENQSFLQRMQSSLSKKAPVTQPGLEVTLTENLARCFSEWRYA